MEIEVSTAALLFPTASLMLLLVSLAISFYEVLLSTNALSLQLGTIKKAVKQK